MGDLSRWLGLNERHRRVAVIGESIMFGGTHTYDGRAWAFQLRERLGTYFLGNPGYGMIPTWAGTPQQYFVNPNTPGPLRYRDTAADWTVGYPNVADNRVFYAQGYYRTGSATEPTKLIEFIRPTFIPTIHHTVIWYVDSTASGDLDVSIDGGAYFTVQTAKAHDHQLKSVTVSQPVGTNIKVRPHTTSQFIFAGFQFFSRSQAPQDCLVDVYAKSGELLTDFVADTNTLDWLDQTQPHLVIMEFWNDCGGLPPPPVVTLANYAAALATWQASLQDVIDRVSSYADVLMFASYEQNRHFVRSQADDVVIQNAFRQGAIDVANANTNVDYVDLFAPFGSSFAAATSAGLLEDYAHPSATGHDLIANLVYAMVGPGATRATIHPTITIPNSDRILDRTYLGQRTDGFVFNLVAANREPLGGSLEVSRRTSPVVRNDTTRQSFRTVEQLSAYNRPSDIDLRRDRLQVLMTLQDGSTFPLGIVMFGQNDVRPATRGELWMPQLFDENFILNQGLYRSWSITKGSSLLGFFTDMAQEVLGPLEIPTAYEVADQAAGSQMAFPAGSSRLTALNAIAQLLGCYPPFFANDGTHTLKQAPDLDAFSTMDHIYELGESSRIHLDSEDLSDNLFNEFNEYIVTGDALGSGVVVRGVYNLPASAPNSIANIGYPVNTSRSVAGLSNAAIAAQMAYIDALTDKTPYRQASFDALPDPRHDTFDTFQLLGQPYAETAWALTCGPPYTHSHQGSGLWLQ